MKLSYFQQVAEAEISYSMELQAVDSEKFPYTPDQALESAQYVLVLFTSTKGTQTHTSQGRIGLVIPLCTQIRETEALRGGVWFTITQQLLNCRHTLAKATQRGIRFEGNLKYLKVTLAIPQLALD